VVDNGSTEAELAPIRTCVTDHQATLIENGHNQGIGAGLNIGVRWACDQGFTWVALFDQDSTCNASFIHDLWITSQSHPRKDSVAITAPLYLDRSTGKVAKRGAATEDGGIMVAMTSGSLMPSWVFERYGYFNEELFIDQVDFEYCLRVRRAKLLVLQSERARLLHSPGVPAWSTIFGVRVFKTSNHSAKRRYYMTRNSVWLMRKFWRDAPSWSLTTLLALVKDTIKISLAEQDRIAKLKNMFLGALHGLQDKLGNTLGL
jgi:rhamnosyltransferase